MSEKPRRRHIQGCPIYVGQGGMPTEEQRRLECTCPPLLRATTEAERALKRERRMPPRDDDAIDLMSASDQLLVRAWFDAGARHGVMLQVARDLGVRVHIVRDAMTRYRRYLVRARQNRLDDAERAAAVEEAARIAREERDAYEAAIRRDAISLHNRAVLAALEDIQARLARLEARPAGGFREDNRRHAEGGRPVREQRREAGVPRRPRRAPSAA